MSGEHVVVVGGGVAGLTAAYDAATGGARVTVLEGAPRLGGKLRTSGVAGIAVDEGAEALLLRRPEGVDLVRELGLGDRLRHAGPASAAIKSRGALRPFPAGQVMGVPTDLAALARSEVLSPGGAARVALDLVLADTPRGGDVSVADHVGARLGREPVERLVEPLLGGVYAGRAEELSFEATMGGLSAASRTRRSLIGAARAVAGAAPKKGGPVFGTLAGGLGVLPATLAERVEAAGGTVRTSAMVRELRRTAGGWRLTVGPTRAPERVDADAVVVAVPARPASRLLAHDVPAAAGELAGIDYASMAIVTLAYPAAAFPEPPAITGYLVPAVEGSEVKAVTVSTTKWPHLDPEGSTVLVRCSIGRYGEAHALQRSDDALATVAGAELAETFGVHGPPVDARVTRWGGGLPQYAVGHVDRVARIRASVADVPGLATCGAAYAGLGVPACVAGARSAAALVLEHLRGRGQLRETANEERG